MNRIPALSRFSAWAVSLPVFLGLVVFPSSAQERDQDYRLQGEYRGYYADSSDSLGAQIIALGAGKFRAVLLPGGLPGQGPGGQPLVEISGTVQSPGVGFSHASGWSMTLDTAGMALTGNNASGKSFVLNKIHRQSPTLNAGPPPEALILFGGEQAETWKDAALDKDGYLLPQGMATTSGAVTKQSFVDFTLHLEFRVPFKPEATGQSRGNSGIYLQNRYELQILDSFGIYPGDSIEAKRQGGAIWEQARPRVNMCLPPLVWQTYDLDFTAARFDATGKTRVSPARISVRHNGLIIHDDWAFPDRTVQGDFEGPNPGPLRLQWHGDSVVYRQIWLVEKSTASLKPGHKQYPFQGNQALRSLRFSSEFPHLGKNILGRKAGLPVFSLPGYRSTQYPILLDSH